MTRVLLLVPPSRGVVIRDYYCSKTSQANYLHPPLDLVVQGGMLRACGAELRLVDATVDRLSGPRAMAAVRDARPEVVFALAGAVQWPADRAFLEQVAASTGAPVYASGDLFMEDPAASLARHPFLAGVLTDFTSDELARHLAGESFVRQDLFLPGDTHRFRRTRHGRAIPVPSHDLFVPRPYRYAFARHYPMAGIYTQYGCPYTCSFCIIGELGSAVRPTANVLAELESLKRLGVRELFVQDQCFGAPRRPFEQLCEAIVSERLDFGWWTFTRVDVIDRDMALAMKAAGCHTVILGVESASEEILGSHRKGYGTKLISEAFAMCESVGLRTAATFILGLPEETPETLSRTIDFACSLPADYASFNVAVPRAGTRLRTEAVAAGTVAADVEVMDQSGFGPTLPNRRMTQRELALWRNRAVRRFYLRPSYIWRRLAHVRTPVELASQAREAWMLVRNLVAR